MNAFMNIENIVWEAWEVSKKMTHRSKIIGKVEFLWRFLSGLAYQKNIRGSTLSVYV